MNYWPQGMTAADYCDPPEMTECEVCGEDYPVSEWDPWINDSVPGTCREECHLLTPLQRDLEIACRKVEAR